MNTNPNMILNMNENDNITIKDPRNKIERTIYYRKMTYTALRAVYKRESCI